MHKIDKHHVLSIGNMNCIASRVVILPTSDTESPLQLQMNDKLHLENGLSIALKSYNHLYFTSDEKIEVGNWFLSDNVVYRCKRNEGEVIIAFDGNYSLPAFFCKKIIVTTDKTLFYNEFDTLNDSVYEQDVLPKPQKDFLRQYVEIYNKFFLSQPPVLYVFIQCTNNYGVVPIDKNISYTIPDGESGINLLTNFNTVNIFMTKLWRI